MERLDGRLSSYEDVINEMLNAMEVVHNRNTGGEWLPDFLNVSPGMTFISTPHGSLIPVSFCECGCLEVFNAYKKIIEKYPRRVAINDVVTICKVFEIVIKNGHQGRDLELRSRLWKND